MNEFEQFKHASLTGIQTALPHLTPAELELVEDALNRAAFGFEVRKQATALSVTTDPIPALLRTYLLVKKTEGLAYGTLQNYAHVLSGFFLWCRKPPEEVSSNEIRMYLFEYSMRRRISDRTLDKYREIICWFFGWAHTEEYINRNPARAVKAIKYEVKERQALTQMELEYIRMACKTKRDRAMVELFYSTGCRVSELTQLKKGDVDWTNYSVHLFGKGRKHRTSYLNAKAIVALKEYLQSRKDTNEMLFVGERAPHANIKKETVEAAIRNISRRAGIGKVITPHVLRHTTATQAVNAGMPIEDVSKLLGHSSVATTMIYAKTSQGKVQAEHNRCIV